MGVLDKILFWRKPYIEKLEKEFETKRLRNCLVFHDFSAAVQNPEEIKNYIVSLLKTADYYIDLNEFTRFEDLGELEPVLTTTRLKPIKVYIRGVKKLVKGLKYPKLFALFLILSIVFALLLLFSDTYFKINKDLVFWLFIASAAITILLGLTRDVTTLFVWSKILGLYNPETNQTDVRVIIAGNVDKKEDEEALNTLRDDITMVYDYLVKKYVKYAKERVASEIIGDVEKMKKILNRYKEVSDALSKLDMRFAKGEIDKKTYLELKSKLETELSKLKLLLDFLE